jgi:hypothetical protein
MFGNKIKIRKEMMERIKEAIDVAGYSSVEEFIESAIERELDKITGSGSENGYEEKEIRAKLQGLGYID